MFNKKYDSLVKRIDELECRLVHNVIGIKDVRVSLRESLVDLIVEARCK